MSIEAPKHTNTGMLFGTFDGAHMGHVSLIENAQLKIKRLGGSGAKLCIVVGRDRTVAGVKGRGPKQSERERMAAIKALFPECVVVLGHKTNRMYWLRKVRPDMVFLGYDQEAFVDILQKEVRNKKKEVSIVRLKPFNEGRYKSSKIKKPHALVRGAVVHGKKLARSVGYPTANIELSSKAKKQVSAQVPSGIYASRAILTGGTTQQNSGKQSSSLRTYLAATVVGARSHGGAPLVETHLIGYRGDCYGAKLTISLEKKLRNFKAYTSQEALKKDIERDIAAVEAYFGRAKNV